MVSFYENVFKSLNLFFVMIDEEGKVLFCNDYTKRFVLTDNIYDAIITKDKESFKKTLHEAKEQANNKTQSLSLGLKSKDGELSTYAFRFSMKYDNEVFTLAGQHLLDFNDIALTEHLKQMNEYDDLNAKMKKAEHYLKLKREELINRLDELEYYANYDDLTDLYNRRKILEEMQNAFDMAVRKEESLSVILIDIDHFKELNESYGHLVGDKIITEVAAIMRRRCRSYEKLGRYAGEQFLIILPNVELNEAIILASSLCKIVKEYYVKLEDQSEIGVTISAGLAQYKIGDDDIDAILRRADEALYNAKASGRDRFRTKE